MQLYQNWKIFLPEYERAHCDVLNKMLHFTGASLLILSIAVSLLIINPLPLIGGVLMAYLLPHIGHRHFEGNCSFAGSRPLFCIAGAFILYLKMWKALLNRIFS